LVFQACTFVAFSSWCLRIPAPVPITLTVLLASLFFLAHKSHILFFLPCGTSVPCRRSSSQTAIFNMQEIVESNRYFQSERSTILMAKKNLMRKPISIYLTNEANTQPKNQSIPYIMPKKHRNKSWSRQGACTTHQVGRGSSTIHSLIAHKTGYGFDSQSEWIF
jgi:hypothetical protein